MLHYVQEVTPVDSCFFLFVQRFLSCYNLGESLTNPIIIRHIYTRQYHMISITLCDEILDSQLQEDSLTSLTNGLHKAAQSIQRIDRIGSHFSPAAHSTRARSRTHHVTIAQLIV